MGDYADYYVDGPGIDRHDPNRPKGVNRTNFFSLPTKHIKGLKDHVCTWCGKPIKKGEEHHYWRSVGDSYTENRMHGPCLSHAVFEGNFKYKPRVHPKAQNVELKVSQKTYNLIKDSPSPEEELKEALLETKAAGDAVLDEMHAALPLQHKD